MTMNDSSSPKERCICQLLLWKKIFADDQSFITRIDSLVEEVRKIQSFEEFKSWVEE